MSEGECVSEREGETGNQWGDTVGGESVYVADYDLCAILFPELELS